MRDSFILVLRRENRMGENEAMGDRRDVWDERAEAERQAAMTAKRGRQVAVALSYDPEVADAPRVVASGHGYLAQQILDTAYAHGVKVREDPDLAEVLAAVDVDTVIPLEAFVAVAEILAYVYKANNSLPGKSSEQAP